MIKETYSDKVKEIMQKAEDGDVKAVCKLGEMYLLGWRVEKDYVKAVEWLTTAARRGDVRAMYELGMMYRYGRGGTERDAVKAIAWFTKAAEAGEAVDVKAMRGWGYVYRFFGSNVSEEDREKAIKAEKAADVKAMYELGEMYLWGEGVEQNHIKAEKWWGKAMSRGHKGAMYNLWWMYYWGRLMRKYKEMAE